MISEGYSRHSFQCALARANTKVKRISRTRKSLEILWISMMSRRERREDLNTHEQEICIGTLSARSNDEESERKRGPEDFAKNYYTARISGIWNDGQTVVHKDR